MQYKVVNNGSCTEYLQSFVSEKGSGMKLYRKNEVTGQPEYIEEGKTEEALRNGELLYLAYEDEKGGKAAEEAVLFLNGSLFVGKEDVRTAVSDELRSGLNYPKAPEEPAAPEGYPRKLDPVKAPGFFSNLVFKIFGYKTGSRKAYDLYQEKKQAYESYEQSSAEYREAYKRWKESPEVKACDEKRQKLGRIETELSDTLKIGALEEQERIPSVEQMRKNGKAANEKKEFLTKMVKHSQLLLSYAVGYGEYQKDPKAEADLELEIGDYLEKNGARLAAAVGGDREFSYTARDIMDTCKSLYTKAAEERRLDQNRMKQEKKLYADERHAVKRELQNINAYEYSRLPQEEKVFWVKNPGKGNLYQDILYASFDKGRREKGFSSNEEKMPLYREWQEDNAEKITDASIDPELYLAAYQEAYGEGSVPGKTEDGKLLVTPEMMERHYAERERIWQARAAVNRGMDPNGPAPQKAQNEQPELPEEEEIEDHSLIRAQNKLRSELEAARKKEEQALQAVKEQLADTPAALRSRIEEAQKVIASPSAPKEKLSEAMQTMQSSLKALNEKHNSVNRYLEDRREDAYLWLKDENATAEQKKDAIAVIAACNSALKPDEALVGTAKPDGQPLTKMELLSLKKRNELQSEKLLEGGSMDTVFAQWKDSIKQNPGFNRLLGSDEAVAAQSAALLAEKEKSVSFMTEMKFVEQVKQKTKELAAGDNTALKNPVKTEEKDLLQLS